MSIEDRERFPGSSHDSVHYRLPLPALDPGSENLDKDRAKILVFKAIEASIAGTARTLSCYEVAMELQLQYASVLAESGEPSRSDTHFSNLLEQVEHGRPCMGPGESIDSVSWLNILQAQTEWFSRCAVAISQAGFLEPAEEVFRRAVTAHSEAQRVRDDTTDTFDSALLERLEQQDFQTNSSLGMAATKIGLYGDAVNLLNAEAPSQANVTDTFIAALSALQRKLAEIGDKDSAELIKTRLHDTIGAAVERIQIDLRDGSSVLSKSIYFIERLVDEMNGAGLTIDHAELFGAMHERLDDEAPEQTIDEYVRLADIYRRAGHREQAYETLTQAMAILHDSFPPGMSKNRSHVANRKLVAIARVHTLLGSSTSDAIAEILPLRYRAEVLADQLRQPNIKSAAQTEAALDVAAQLINELRDKPPQSPKAINQIIVNIVLALGASGNYEKMTSLYNDTCQAQSVYHGQASLSGISSSTQLELAKSLYAAGEMEEAFVLLDQLSITAPPRAADFLLSVLKDICKRDVSTDTKVLVDVSDHLQDYVINLAQ